MSNLSGRIAIVTGAGSGIGQATASVLARRGASVVVADINSEAIERVVQGLRDDGLRVTGVTVDVADETQIRAMVDTAVREFGGLDILHNNAALTGAEAGSHDMAIIDLDAEVFARVLRVNLAGYALAAKHAIPHMIRRGGGVIINTSAITAGLPELVRPMYSMSKGGVNALTLNIAAQYGRKGIRAVGVAPGVIVTPAVRKLIPQRMLDGFARHTLTPRLGTTEDVAYLVAFLVSDEAGFITGETINVDGGMTAHYPNYADELVAMEAAQPA